MKGKGALEDVGALEGVGAPEDVGAFDGDGVVKKTAEAQCDEPP